MHVGCTRNSRRGLAPCRLFAVRRGCSRMRSFATDTAEGAVKPSRKQVLGDRFLLGEELGRGAYGTVFKGIDTTSGDTVAIKQISLAGISQDNLQGVMGEIELLKTLNHKNIVKYVGSFKSRSHLYIILEYMENGALSAMIKPNRCGIFPETLVAVFIAQYLIPEMSHIIATL
ncbi:predicted protein [Haematococcus lacustris]|uniref:non-specific serine/threonine protein kinase n=1 Tax=Haematococcus lacustris TaxID=44745 RepID=A0A6A0A0E5_HAELA|nr:predicted protein [Haematococcus lacustris]